MRIRDLLKSPYFERIAELGRVVYYRVRQPYTITHYGVKVESIEFRAINTASFWVNTVSGTYHYQNTNTVTLHAYETLDRGMI